MAIKIKQIAQDIAIDESGKEYIISTEKKGANKKFWLKDPTKVMDTFLIRFSTHPKKPNAIDELSLYNEVICSKICENLGLNHVTYEMCEFTDLDGNVSQSVICPNYKESIKHIELSGKTLLDYYQSWAYDNNYGEIPELPINTLYTYIELLKNRYESRRMKMSPETEARLSEEILTLAAFDFCTCQIDRHWKNIGWINNNMYDDNKFRVWMIPIYDNECSFLLDEATPEDVEKITTLIHTPKKQHNVVEMVNRKRVNSPYLGIKTSLVRLKDGSDSFLVPLSDQNNMSNAMILAQELAKEIYHRPNLKKLYDKIIAFDMEKFMDEIDFISEENLKTKDIYTFVWNTRVKLLKESFEKYKKEAEGEQNNDKNLS